MKTKILSTLKILCAVIITLGALHVFANGYSYTGYNEPSSQGENAFRPVNVSSEDQVMASSFYSKSFLKAGNSVAVPAPFTAASPTWNNSSAFVAEKSIISPRAIINRYLFLPGKNSQVKVGSSGSSLNPNLPPSQPFTGDLTTPLIIDMKGRGSGVNDRSGREAMQFSSGSVGTTVLVNTPAIQFSSTKNVSTDSGVAKADIIAGALQLSEPNAGALKVLVATDDKGNAVWGTMKIVSNTDGTKRIQVDYPGSPVATGQNSCDAAPPQPVDLCTNIEGIQTAIQAGMIKDTPGNTPGICTTPVVDCKTYKSVVPGQIPADFTNVGNMSILSGSYSSSLTQDICTYTHNVNPPYGNLDSVSIRAATPSGYTCVIASNPPGDTPAQFKCTDNANIQPVKVYTCPSTIDVAYDMRNQPGFGQYTYTTSRERAFLQTDFGVKNMYCDYSATPDFTQTRAR